MKRDIESMSISMIVEELIREASRGRIVQSEEGQFANEVIEHLGFEGLRVVVGEHDKEFVEFRNAEMSEDFC